MSYPAGLVGAGQSKYATHLAAIGRVVVVIDSPAG